MGALEEKGLTLLEVLVALVILAVALTAIIKATTENVRATAHLQEKTIATWIALEAINKARLDLLTLPQAPEKRTASEVVLGQSWEWQGLRQPTSNPRIQEIQIRVFHLPDHQQLSELTGYLYVG